MTVVPIYVTVIFTVYSLKVSLIMSELFLKEEIEVIDEPINIQSVEIKLKERIEIYEKLIHFTGEGYLVNHDELVITEHQITSTDEKPFQGSQCDMKLPYKCPLKRH
ncbi:unnamed protein product [Meganyctiphanes norvegica]|uniref:Uncharacterized protein n=1 Tax=Meganyctiphanes norvegica TaxID=48144 RepID=A0AAV2PIH8_MEGNR